MRQPPAPFGLALAAAAAAGLVRAWVSGAWPWWSFAGDAPGLPLFPAGTWTPLALAWTALTGRILLSWLPPGRIGGHGPAELPSTWATSHLLGTVAAQALVVAGPGPLHPAVAIAWLLLGGARLLTLPAAMVPRHAPACERSSPAVRVGRAGAVLVVLGLALCIATRHPSSQAPAFAAAHYLATATVLAWALRVARLAPAGRLTVWTLFALTPALFTTGLLGVLGCAAGAGFAVAWWRRACRRSLWLSAGGWAALLLAGEPDVAALGFLLLVALSPPAARPRPLLVGALSAWALVLALGAFSGVAVDERLFAAVLRVDLFGLAWVAFAAALLAGWVLPFPAREPQARVEPPHRTASACLALVVGTVVLRTLLWDSIDPLRTLALLLPAVALLCGAVFVRTERPG